MDDRSFPRRRVSRQGRECPRAQQSPRFGGSCYVPRLGLPTAETSERGIVTTQRKQLHPTLSNALETCFAGSEVLVLHR